MGPSVVSGRFPDWPTLPHPVWGGRTPAFQALIPPPPRPPPLPSTVLGCPLSLALFFSPPPTSATWP